MIDRELCQRVWDRFEQGMECEKCGNSDRRVLEFHHRDPAKRKFSPRYSRSVHKSLVGTFLEMDKCDILCANCHLIAHWKMRQEQQKRQREFWAKRQWEIAEVLI